MRKKVLSLLISVATVFLLGAIIVQGYSGNLESRQISPNPNKNKEVEIVEEKTDDEEEIEKVKITEMTISAAGDLMLHMPVVYSAKDYETGNYNFDPIFKYIKEINDSSDFSIVNLETIICEDRNLSGYPLFNSPKDIIPTIKKSGFDIVGMANNHTYDQGKTGIMNTIELIENEGLEYIGSNKSPESERVRILEKDDLKLGLICYTYGLNGHIPEADYLVNVINLDKISEDITNLKNQNVDKIIFFVHWGVEYNSKVYDELREFAHTVLDLGVDYILGSHPHVIMPVERVGEEKFIAYSMGNFISNQREEYLLQKGVEDGLMIRFTVEKNDGEVSLKNLEIIPTWVNKYYDKKWNYEILPVYKTLNDEYFPIGDILRNELEASKMRTEEILNN